jgi:F420-dependent methylenetetrahydromethanopterin dehydrogenase
MTEDPSVICGGAKDWLSPLWMFANEVVSEYGVPPIVIAGPPGARVWEPMMYSVEGFGVIVVESIVRTGAIAVITPDAGEGFVSWLFGAPVSGMAWLLVC